jgi:hypothetical protein
MFGYEIGPSVPLFLFSTPILVLKYFHYFILTTKFVSERENSLLLLHSFGKKKSLYFCTFFFLLCELTETTWQGL